MGLPGSKSNGISAPCMNCENKGCGSYHDVCPEYREFRKMRDEINKKRVVAVSKELRKRESIRRNRKELLNNSPAKGVKK